MLSQGAQVRVLIKLDGLSCVAFFLSGIVCVCVCVFFGGNQNLTQPMDPEIKV